nr:hypothetical protein [Tanacetum cinerariifolium]
MLPDNMFLRTSNFIRLLRLSRSGGKVSVKDYGGSAIICCYGGGGGGGEEEEGGVMMEIGHWGSGAWGGGNFLYIVKEIVNKEISGCKWLSEYCSIDATICRYLSGTAFNNLRTNVSSSIVCPRLTALFTKVVSFVVKASIVTSSFMCSISNSDLRVCNRA